MLTCKSHARQAGPTWHMLAKHEAEELTRVWCAEQRKHGKRKLEDADVCKIDSF